MEIGVVGIVGLIAVVFVVVAGGVLALFVTTFRRIRRGDLVRRSPQNGWRHDPSHSTTATWTGGTTDYTSGP